MATSTSAKDRSAAKGKGVVVWEWFNESSKWRPYSPEVVAYIDKEVAQNASQTVQLGIISQPLKMYTVDFPSMCQIRKGTGTSRPLRRVIYPEHSPPAQQVMWEFEGDQAGQWVPYDMEISHCLEHAHQGGHKMLDMHSLFQIPYSVHFTTMQQVRMNTGRARQIRRSPLQMPYPSASKSPKFLNRLSTVLPAFTLPPAVTQRASTSASAAPNLSSAGASGSGTQKRMMMLSSSDSSSDSDDSGIKRRARTRLHKKMKKVHIRGGSWGKKSSSGKSAAPPSATQTAGGSISSSSSNSSLTGSASGLMAPTPYRMPNVSLASAGPAMSLNLITYPQPLGANLSQGFPPMAHMPPSSSQPQAHSHQPAPSYHYNTQQGLQHSVLSLTHQGNPQASSQHQGASQSQSQAHVSASQAGSYISPAQSQSHSLGAPSAAHSHHTTHHSRLKVSQGYMSHSQVPPPSTSSSSWMGIPTTMMPASSLPSTSSMHSSLMAHPLTMTATAMSGQPLTAHSATQLQMASGMTYQGPLTRNRLHKQQQVVGPGAAGSGGSSSSSGGGGSSAGGGGMMGGQVLTSGMNGVHSMIGQIPHCYSSSQPHGYPGSKSGASQPGSHLSMSLRHLQQQQQQQQQMQQLQHQVPSMGSGYPFNLSSFVPTLGLNILPQSALLLPGSSNAQQHMPSHPSVGSSRGQQHPANLPVTETLPDEKKIILPKLKKTKHKPKSAEDVLNKYMETVPPQEEDCSICYDTLTGPSSYGEGKPGQLDVIQLNKCSHRFHRLCLLAMYDSSHKGDSLQCPTCKTIYGELMGNCPAGDMEYDIIPRSLPGHPPHCATIRVTYYISPGIQGPEHPHPGQRFTARGFPRSGFLPDDNRGRKILKMMMMAFRRRLMFTIGQSATTGESDTVTWNEIHHKTEFGSNVSGHGYPDPNYMDNVTAELALKGVNEQDV